MVAPVTAISPPPNMPQTVLRPQFGSTPQPFAIGFEPIIIDLSKRRKKRLLMKGAKIGVFALCAVAAVAIPYFTSRVPENKPASAPQPNKEIAGPAYFIPAPAEEEAPVKEAAQAAQPHLTLPPIPKEALSPEVAQLMPILDKLPVGKDFRNKVKNKKSPAGAPKLSISVVRDSHLTRHDQNVRKAAEAVQNGKQEEAIKLYSAALKAVPDDRDAAYNLASLLLQKAAFLDSKGESEAAIPVYERVLKVWGEKDGIAASVHQRLDWLKHKPGPLLAPAAYTPTTEADDASE